jgi:DNA ligase D-like protein (predicted 3'-phosphoesterase)
MTARDELGEYKSKRDFRKTKEPSGRKGAKDKQIFVIQKHAARNLHYDLRLSIDGVLKSWAVPKGPSTDPRVKRLAILTEDHPFDYADFEGIIPEGEYGAGKVLVWDRGTYVNLRGEKEKGKGKGRSMRESFEDGQIEVWLEGEKLDGGYALIRTGKGDKERWLLVKMKDEGADARRNPTSTQPESVISGLEIEDLE